jgi:hypothetical protein
MAKRRVKMMMRMRKTKMKRKKTKMALDLAATKVAVPQRNLNRKTMPQALMVVISLKREKEPMGRKRSPRRRL